LSITTPQMTLSTFDSKVMVKAFYFPRAGTFRQYPAHVSAHREGENRMLAYATEAPAVLLVHDQAEVVRRERETLYAEQQAASLAGIKSRDWNLVSQLDDDAALVEFLSRERLSDLPLERMLWRFNGGHDDGHTSTSTSTSSGISATFEIFGGLVSFGSSQSPPKTDPAVAALGAHRRRLFFQVVQVLRERCIFSAPVWAYVLAFVPDGAGAGRDLVYERTLCEYLGSQATVRNCVGPYLSCALLSVDEIESLVLQHREYTPLINARAYQVKMGGGANNNELVIRNVEFAKHYRQFLRWAAYRSASASTLPVDQRLELVYYLLLQDRVQQASDLFREVEQKLQTTVGKKRNRATATLSAAFDYMRCYFAFCDGKPAAAAEIARAYADYPLAKQRRLFQEVSQQAAEMQPRDIPMPADNEEAKASDAPDLKNDALARDRHAMDAAAQEASVSFDVMSGGSLHIQVAGCTQVRVNLFPMLVSAAFTLAPFSFASSSDASSSSSSSSSSVLCALPTRSILVDVPAHGDKRLASVDYVLPDDFKTRDSWIQVETLDGTASSIKPHLAHRMRIDIKQNRGLVYVSDATTGVPLAGAYVKVYGQKKEDGKAFFFKDCTTDGRGVADFVSLSTNELAQVRRFSMLITNATHGSTIRQVDPPAQ
jgi:hypothetical protein